MNTLSKDLIETLHRLELYRQKKELLHNQEIKKTNKKSVIKERQIEENGNIFYNYVYLDPRKPGNYNYGEYHFDYEPFYVGKGSNGRYRVKHNGDCEKLRKDIMVENLEVIYVFPYKNLCKEVALNNEEKLIKNIGKKDLGLGPLLNKMGGSRKPQQNIL